jgi:hypothetical protein
MKALILAIAAMLALAAGMTTGAMASSHKAGRGSHVTRIHANGTHGWARHARGYAAVDGSAYDYSGAKSLGPLGFTFGCVHGYCGQGYSVSAWSY